MMNGNVKIKHQFKWRVYWFATSVFDWGVPLLTWCADQVRDWAFNEDMYD